MLESSHSLSLSHNPYNKFPQQIQGIQDWINYNKIWYKIKANTIHICKLQLYRQHHRSKVTGHCKLSRWISYLLGTQVNASTYRHWQHIQLLPRFDKTKGKGRFHLYLGNRAHPLTDTHRRIQHLLYGRVFKMVTCIISSSEISICTIHNIKDHSQYQPSMIVTLNMKIQWESLIFQNLAYISFTFTR